MRAPVGILRKILFIAFFSLVAEAHAQDEKPNFIKIDKNNCSKVAGATTGYGDLLADTYRLNPAELSFRGTQIDRDGLCSASFGFSKGILRCGAVCGVLKKDGMIILHSCVGGGDKVYPMLNPDCGQN